MGSTKTALQVSPAMAEPGFLLALADWEAGHDLLWPKRSPLKGFIS